MWHYWVKTSEVNELIIAEFDYSARCTSRHCRCDLIINSFLATNEFNELPQMCFKFPFNLIGKSTMAFLTGQLWPVLKYWYTGEA